ncbi:MAG: MFS transporter [Candidatus Omnitrophica bacterium]|nr:MFS transporter [Candidatus Omnitrophota bacterium]
MILRICSGGMICVAIAANLIPVYLTTFSETFGGLGEEQLGRIPALLFAGFIVGILTCGPLADRLGAKLFMTGGFGLSAIGLLLLGTAPTYSILLSAAALCGVGAGMLDMIVSPVVAAVSIHRKSAALNRVHSFFCVGAVGTLAIASLGLEMGAPWRGVTVGFALIPAALAAVVLKTDLPPLIHPEQARQGFRYLIRAPRFYIAMLMILLVGATDSGVAQWLPAYSEKELGLSKAMGGYLLTGFSIAMWIGRWIASLEQGKIPPHVILGFSSLLCFALYLTGTLSQSNWIAASACVLVGFACSATWPTCLGMTSDRFPQGGATLFALLAAGGNIGCLIVPWAEGMVAEKWDIRTAILSCSVFPLTLALIVGALWIVEGRRK